MNGYYVLGLLSVTIASFSQILLKKGAMKQYDSFIKEYLNVFVISGYVMMFGSVFLTMIVYRGMDFMNVPVLEAVGYVLVPVLSYLFFKEKLTMKKILGIIFILAGIVIYYA
ncbi:MAG: EamA family transporter [Eubacterium sp.]|nr:EamA family transporter [Eubacterium sp.]